ncbi:hypothetical protein EYD45_02115 [Hyunsoonleella flava]|uniref:DUF3078 domain-containing protein n=1 Tax=Hyunsoonleella flava TaxID=2527939 RepID=A0A4Q9FIA0_9FLAO|nr:hypothetical protein [Hyunsoonleella flava]TBN06702.1 hypothetical protein EYD45_02115 [Hyunsoonleella flava]
MKTKNKKKLCLMPLLALSLIIYNAHGQLSTYSSFEDFSEIKTNTFKKSKEDEEGKRAGNNFDDNYGLINLEVALWYGATFSELADENGLRRFDAKYEINKKNLVFAYYDNALTFDNNFFANSNGNVPMIGVGAKHDWSKKWFSKVEFGRRFMIDQDDQSMFNLENGYFFSDKVLGKIVTQYDIRQDDNLLTLGAFVDLKVNKWMRLESGLFHSENLAFTNTYNERFLVIPKMRWKKVELNMGVYYDVYKLQQERLNQFSGGFSHIIFPIIKNLKGNAFFNYDKGFKNEITVVSIGLNQKF